MTRISKLTKLSCAILLSSSAMSMELTKEQQIRNLQELFSEVDIGTLEVVYDDTNGDMGKIFDFFKPAQVPIVISTKTKKEQQLESLQQKFSGLSLDSEFLSEIYDQANGDMEAITSMFQIPVQESPKVNNNSFINHINIPLNNDLPSQLMEINRKISEQKINLMNSERDRLDTATKKENIKNNLIHTLWTIRGDNIEELEEQISKCIGKIQGLTNLRKNLTSEYDISQKYFDKRMKLFDDFKGYPELREKWDNKYLEEQEKEISQTAIEKELINVKISEINKKLSNFKSRLNNGFNQKYINDNIDMWNKIGLGKDFVEAIRFVRDTPINKMQDFIETEVETLKDLTTYLKNYNEGVNNIESQLFELNSKKENIEHKILAIKKEEQQIEAERLEIERKAEEEKRRIEAEQLIIKRKAEAEQLHSASINNIINMFETIKIDTKSKNWDTIKDQLTKLTDNIIALTWKDESGKNLFHIAAENNSMGAVVISQLCTNFHAISESFINQPSNNGSTPLHLAVFSGNHAGIIFLLNSGADIFAKTPAGITILEAAAMYLEGCEEEGDETKINNAKDIIEIILNTQYGQDKGDDINGGHDNGPSTNMNTLWRTNDTVKKYVENRISHYEAERKKRLDIERVDREHREYVQRVRLEQEALAQKKATEEKELKKKLESERIQRERLEQQRMEREERQRENEQQQYYYQNHSYRQQNNYR